MLATCKFLFIAFDDWLQRIEFVLALLHIAANSALRLLPIGVKRCCLVVGSFMHLFATAFLLPLVTALPPFFHDGVIIYLLGFFQLSTCTYIIIVKLWSFIYLNVTYNYYFIMLYMQLCI